jgi:hypothetical protein
LIDLFLDTECGVLPRVEHYTLKGTAETIEQEARALKGAVWNFTDERAFEAALKLETMGREGSLKHTDGAFKDLEREINLVTDVVVSFRKNNFQDLWLCTGSS